MRSSQIFSAVLGASIVLAPLPAPAARAPAPPPGEEDSEAKQLFNARKYPDAAVAFEQLFAATRAPKHLFNAAMARELAGHEGHAYLLLRRYLALPDVQPAELARAGDRLAALQRRTAAVRVIVQSSAATPLRPHNLQIAIERTVTGAIDDPGRAPLRIDAELLPLLTPGDLPDAVDLYLEQGPWVVSAQADGHERARQDLAVEGNQAQIALTLPALAPAATAVTVTVAPSDAIAQGAQIALRRAGDPSTATQAAANIAWQLSPGSYTLSASAPGYLPIERTFTVTDKPLALDLEFLPETEPGVPPHKKNPPTRRDPWVLGPGIAGGITAVAGAVVLGVGASHWSRALGRYGEYAGTNPADWNTASANLIKSWTLSGTGAGLLGGGIGLGLGAVGMHFAPRLTRQKPLWGAGLGVGAVLAVAGGLLIGRSGLGLQNTQSAHAANFTTLGPDAPDAYAGKNHHIGLSAALLGFGVGLGVTSVLGLVRPSSASSIKKAALLPTGTGVVLTGRF